METSTAPSALRHHYSLSGDTVDVTWIYGRPRSVRRAGAARAMRAPNERSRRLTGRKVSCSAGRSEVSQMPGDPPGVLIAAIEQRCAGACVRRQTQARPVWRAERLPTRGAVSTVLHVAHVMSPVAPASSGGVASRAPMAILPISLGQPLLPVRLDGSASPGYVADGRCCWGRDRQHQPDRHPGQQRATSAPQRRSATQHPVTLPNQGPSPAEARPLNQPPT